MPQSDRFPRIPPQFSFLWQLLWCRRELLRRLLPEVVRSSGTMPDSAGAGMAQTVDRGRGARTPFGGY